MNVCLCFLQIYTIMNDDSFTCFTYYYCLVVFISFRLRSELGDFNAHNSLWGCVDTNAKGLEIATFLLQFLKQSMLNKKDITGSRSSIDLAICDPALFLDISSSDFINMQKCSFGNHTNHTSAEG